MDAKELIEYLEKNNPYAEDFFPAKVEEVGKHLRDRGLSDLEITAISGCLCRHGYWVAIKSVEHYFED